MSRESAKEIRRTWTQISFLLSEGKSLLLLGNIDSICTHTHTRALTYTQAVQGTGWLRGQTVQMSWKSVPGSFLSFVLSHLRVWLTISSSDWKQNSPGLDLAFIKHPYIKTKVMSIMKKVPAKSVYQSSCPWRQLVVTQLCLSQYKVLTLELKSKPTYPVAHNAICIHLAVLSICI